MEIFSPIIWFKRVDFPTFGAPTIATKPDLKFFNLSFMFDMLFIEVVSKPPLRLNLCVGVSRPILEIFPIFLWLAAPVRLDLKPD